MARLNTALEAAERFKRWAEKREVVGVTLGEPEDGIVTVTFPRGAAARYFRETGERLRG